MTRYFCAAWVLANAAASGLSGVGEFAGVGVKSGIGIGTGVDDGSAADMPGVLFVGVTGAGAAHAERASAKIKIARAPSSHLIEGNSIGHSLLYNASFGNYAELC